MHWNVTYNDPNRWKEVHAFAGPRLPWCKGIRETVAGRSLGSPKLDLVHITGIPELQALRDGLSERTAINFLRTAEGLIAFTKVRLEVYAIPIHWNEAVSCTQQGDLTVAFERDGHRVELFMRGSKSAEARFRNWFEQAANEFHVSD